MAYGLTWTAHGIEVKYTGALVAEEMLACHWQIATDSRFDDLRSVIIDTLQVASTSLTRSDVEEIDAFLRGPSLSNPNVQVAVVATHPGVIQALSWYDAIQDRAFDVLLCGSVEAARRLFKIIAPTFRPRGSARK